MTKFLVIILMMVGFMAPQFSYSQEYGDDEGMNFNSENEGMEEPAKKPVAKKADKKANKKMAKKKKGLKKERKRPKNKG